MCPLVSFREWDGCLQPSFVLPAQMAESSAGCKALIIFTIKSAPLRSRTTVKLTKSFSISTRSSIWGNCRAGTGAKKKVRRQLAAKDLFGEVFFPHLSASIYCQRCGCGGAGRAVRAWTRNAPMAPSMQREQFCRPRPGSCQSIRGYQSSGSHAASA